MALLGFTARRRWKHSADQAVSLPHLNAHRHFAANKVASHLPRRANLPLSALEAEVLAKLDDLAVRAALAARYLDSLHEAALFAEYEEAKALETELRWAEHYLQSTLAGPLHAPTPTVASASQPDARQQQVAEALAQIMVSRLSLANSGHSSAA